ncbi:hypothetical protein KQI84_10450 [bacterium]|nr:hypothetical protein [bacterium]
MRPVLLALCITLLSGLAPAMPYSPAGATLINGKTREERIKEHEERVRGIIEERRLQRLAEGDAVSTATAEPVLPDLPPRPIPQAPLPMTEEDLQADPALQGGVEALIDRVRFVPKPVAIDGIEVTLPAYVDDVQIEGLPPMRLDVIRAEAIVQAGDFRWIVSSDGTTRPMTIGELDLIRRRHLDELKSWGPPATAMFRQAKVEQVCQVLANAAGVRIDVDPSLAGRRVSVVQKDVPTGTILRNICLKEGWTFDLTEGGALLRAYPLAPDLNRALSQECTLISIDADKAVIGTIEGPMEVTVGARIPIPLIGGGAFLAEVVAVRPERYEVEFRLGDKTAWIVGFPDKYANAPVTAIFQEAQIRQILMVIGNSVPGLTIAVDDNLGLTRASIVLKDKPAREVLGILARTTRLSYRWTGPDRLVFGEPEDLAKLGE